MIKEVKQSQVVCDCCGVILVKRDAFRNDGSYQNSYVEKNEVDICFNCAGKIFDLCIIKNVSQEQVNEFVKKLKEKDKPLGCRIEIQPLSEKNTNQNILNADSLISTSTTLNNVELTTNDLKRVLTLEELK